jgi:hypothetical protein
MPQELKLANELHCKPRESSPHYHSFLVAVIIHLVPIHSLIKAVFVECHWLFACWHTVTFHSLGSLFVQHVSAL